MVENDCETIAKSFERQNWHKPLTQYQNYWSEQTQGTREVLVAAADTEFAGYLTIIRQSDFENFRAQNIPEIVDFNVLIKFRQRGIGSALMESAENLIAEKHDFAGIRVGLTGDYGAAQRMYVKRGYIPDGSGISQNGAALQFGDKIIVDDDLALSFTKKLR